MTSTKLICPECQRENESERIYCHDCGARLDRSAVVPPKTVNRVAQERKRVRAMFNSRRALMRVWFFRTCKVILGAFVAAVIVQFILPPVDVPPSPKESLVLSQIGLDLEKAVLQHNVPSLQFSQDQVNEYLQRVTKTKPALNKPLLKFDRAFAEFSEGKVAITAQRSVFGYPLYTRTAFEVQTSGDAFKVTNKGGAIGRMPIHPQLMEYLNILFSDVWSAFDRERRLVEKTNDVEFHDKSVTLITTPPQ